MRFIILVLAVWPSWGEVTWTQVPLADVIGTASNTAGFGPYAAYNPESFITKLSSVVTAGVPLASTFAAKATYTCTSFTPLTTSVIVEGNDLGLVPLTEGDLSCSTLTWSACGEELEMACTVSTTGDRFGALRVGGTTFRLHLHYVSPLDTFDDAYTKAVRFQPASVTEVNGALTFMLSVLSLYETDGTFTMVNVGQCTNPLEETSTCSVLPSTWETIFFDGLSGAARYGALFTGVGPTSYDVAHLTDAAWVRYPVPPAPWAMVPLSSIGDHLVDGVEYQLSVGLDDLLSTCTSLGSPVVQVSHVGGDVRYALDVSLSLLREDAASVYSQECHTEPYLISVNAELEATLVHETSNGIEVAVVSAALEPCTPCVPGLYPCGYDNEHRLSVTLALDVPLNNGLFQGVREGGVLSEPNCAGFPVGASTGYVREELSSGGTRTALTLKSKCMSLGADTDCSRFNKCEGFPLWTDHSVDVLLHECPTYACLDDPSCTLCTAAANPIHVGVTLLVHDCPSVEQEIGLEVASLVRVYHGVSGALMSNAVFHNHDDAVFAIETDSAFFASRMTVWLRHVRLCHVRADATAAHRAFATDGGTACPVARGCQAAAWSAYCAANACIAPVDHEYPLLNEYVPYPAFVEPFGFDVCKDPSGFCSQGQRACGWGLATPVGTADAYDAFRVHCSMLSLDTEASSTWMVDMVGSMWDCDASRRLESAKVAHGAATFSLVTPPQEGGPRVRSYLLVLTVTVVFAVVYWMAGGARRGTRGRGRDPLGSPSPRGSWGAEACAPLLQRERRLVEERHRRAETERRKAERVAKETERLWVMQDAHRSAREQREKAWKETEEQLVEREELMRQNLENMMQQQSVYRVPLQHQLTRVHERTAEARARVLASDAYRAWKEKKVAEGRLRAELEAVARTASEREKRARGELDAAVAHHREAAVQHAATSAEEDAEAAHEEDRLRSVVTTLGRSSRTSS